MKREDLPASDLLASIGLAAASVVASVLVRAVALGGKVIAAGLGTIEEALRGGDEDAPAHSGGTVTRLREGRAVQDDEDVEAAPWADGVDVLPVEAQFEAPFEPADGLTPPARPARSAPRRSSAGATARSTPSPRPAKRATARTVPPPLRPVHNGPIAQPRIDGLAGPGTAGDAPFKAASPSASPSTQSVEPAQPGTSGRPVRKTSATRTTAAKATSAKKAPAKRTATKTTATKTTAQAQKSALRAAQKAAQKSAQQAAQKSAQKAAQKSAQKAPATGAPQENPAQAGTEDSTQGSTESSTQSSTQSSTEGTPQS